MITRPCDFCQEPYQAEPRYLNRGQGQYCSRACSGKAKAARTLPPEPNVKCAFCNKVFYLSNSKQANSKSGLFFCSKEHQNEGFRENIVKPGPKSDITLKSCDHCGRKWQSRYSTCNVCELDLKIQAWLDGDNSVTLNEGQTKETKRFVKEHLIATRGDKCEVCGWNEKAPDGRSIIQMDHIDGNCMNNLIDNLRLLCPNHHAMTPNYGSLNAGSGRAHRRKFG